MVQKILKFLNSFRNAFVGMINGLEERNMRIHVLAMVVVVGLGWFVRLTKTEWFIVFILIGSVMSAELLNTAIEEMADTLRDELKLKYPATKKIRDLAAGGVLVISIVAAIIGWLIFYPKILLVI